MDKKIKECIFCDDNKAIIDLLNSGLDPNYGGGWPIRLAARNGSCAIVKTLLHYGANPHLLGEAGASTLQLAVFSGALWNTDSWTFLLSYCDSSQLADGAAVAIIFNNVPALTRILETRRCNTNIPTTLTGKTIEDLAKGYKLHNLLNEIGTPNLRNVTPTASPRTSRVNRTDAGSLLSPRPSTSQRTLSPSVARFFDMTSRQTGLSPPQNSMIVLSPMAQLR